MSRAAETPVDRPARVLVVGATGYVGGRLVPRLLEQGHEVHVLVRDPHRIEGRSWANLVKPVAGDLLDREGLADACRDMDAAYYLVHSMWGGADFARRDREAALNFARAAQGIGHVIYLGGLVPVSGATSEHQLSRLEVGEILRKSLPTTELRAGPIIGSGSGSFEMIRYLSERVPLVIGPRAMLNTVQPIAIRDVLSYLLLALDHAPGGVIEIGGADHPSFEEMILQYAEVRRLHRIVLCLPLPFAPNLVASWVHLVTPVPRELAAPLLSGIRCPIIADPARATALFPQVSPMTYRRSVELALERIEQGRVETRWSGALGGGPTYELLDWEGLIREVRSRFVDAPPERVFHVCSSLGGDRGWLVWSWAWHARGILDKLAGGPGLRRGRRDPHDLLPGEAVDFWRVEIVDRPHLLRLRAEMRVPGRAWLQWETRPENGGTRLIQTALFGPRGLLGTLYWDALYFIHGRIFNALVDAIRAEAESDEHDEASVEEK